MADFESFDDDFFDADEPYDTLVLDIVQEQQRAIWDELENSFSISLPVVTSGSDTTGDRGHKYATPGDWHCIAAVPFIQEPGDTQIKVHLNCRAYSEQGTADMKVCAGFGLNPAPQGDYNQVVATVTGSSTFGWETVTLDLQPVSTRYFGALQIWVCSELDGYLPSQLDAFTDDDQPAIPILTDNEVATLDWVKDAAEKWTTLAPYTQDLDSNMFVGYDASDDTTIFRNVVAYEDKVFSGTGNRAFGVFPPLGVFDSDSLADRWGIQEFPFLEVRAITCQLVKESSSAPSRLSSAPDDIIRAGRATKSSTALQQTVADDILFRRRRILFAGFPRSTDNYTAADQRHDVFGIASYDVTNGYATTDNVDPFETYVPIQAHLKHRKVVAYMFVAGLSNDITSGLRGPKRVISDGLETISMDFELELMEIDSGGDPASLSPKREAVAENFSIKSMVPNSDSFLNFFREQTLGGLGRVKVLTSGDIRQLMGGISLVRVELPELDESAVYSSDTDRQPHLLRIKASFSAESDTYNPAAPQGNFTAVICGMSVVTEY